MGIPAGLSWAPHLPGSLVKHCGSPSRAFTALQVEKEGRSQVSSLGRRLYTEEGVDPGFRVFLWEEQGGKGEEILAHSLHICPNLKPTFHGLQNVAK